MYNFLVSENLQKILEKLSKKDKNRYDQVMNKMTEIINTPDVEHYKNLGYNVQDSKRVHIGHFVLTFQFDKKTNTIKFDDYDHHDNIYGNRK